MDGEFFQENIEMEEKVPSCQDGCQVSTFFSFSSRTANKYPGIFIKGGNIINCFVLTFFLDSGVKGDYHYFSMF
jgi:hypothetical protein